jgi:type IX secretion system PorP/SprF family membrane protein
MNTITRIAFLLIISACAKAQLTSYNQYNGALAQINPALIAHVDRNQLSVIGRSQWPGLHNGMVTSTLTFNNFFQHINTGIGLIAQYNYGTQNNNFSKTAGLQYAYRILFLEQYYLCAGLSATYTQSQVNMNDLHPGFEPKALYPPLPPHTISSETTQLGYGVAVYNSDTRNYAGFSVRDQPVNVLQAPTCRIYNRPTYSLHGMHQLPVTRESMLMLFGEISRNGSLVYLGESGKQTLASPYMYFFLQGNFYHRDWGVLGVGYKYFSGHYGMFNFRVCPFAGKLKAFTIGYSYDTKPYIQYDKIHFVSSHEVWLKIKFNANR